MKPCPKFTQVISSRQYEIKRSKKIGFEFKLECTDMHSRSSRNKFQKYYNAINFQIEADW